MKRPVRLLRGCFFDLRAMSFPLSGLAPGAAWRPPVYFVKYSAAPAIAAASEMETYQFLPAAVV